MTTINKRWPEPITQNVVVADATPSASSSSTMVATSDRDAAMPKRSPTGASFWVMLCLTIATGAAGLALGEVPHAKSPSLAAAAPQAAITAAVTVIATPDAEPAAAAHAAEAPAPTAIATPTPAEEPTQWLAFAEPASRGARQAKSAKVAAKPAPRIAPKVATKKGATVTTSPVVVVAPTADATIQDALLIP
jgi:hypothetical protein